VEAGVRQEPDVRARPEPFRTNMALAIDLVEETIRHQGPCGVVVFDAWSLAAAVVQVRARRRTDGSRRLHKNRRLETASLQRREATGWALKRPGPHLAVEDRMSLIPGQADRPVTVRGHPSWYCTLGVRLPGRRQGRLVVRCEQESWTGRSVVLVTHRVDGRAAQIIGRDLQRWPRETCDQDG
jgi:hypothetical protein